MVFEHFVLTRFNIKYKDWDKKFPHIVCDSSWMEYRFRLFEIFCLPSMRNQSNLQFKWLVLFDETTSEEHRVRIREYHKVFQNLTPIFITGKNFIKDIQQHLARSQADFLITTRLDSDDAYHSNAIDVIQQHFQAQDFKFLNFKKGYIYDLQKNRLQAQTYISGPFMTLIEKKKDLIMNKTVFCEDHQLMAGLYPVFDIVDDRYWLQVVHEKNLVNDMNYSIYSARYWLDLIRHFNEDRLENLMDQPYCCFNSRSIFRNFGVVAYNNSY